MKIIDRLFCYTLRDAEDRIKQQNPPEKDIFVFIV